MWAGCYAGSTRPAGDHHGARLAIPFARRDRHEAKVFEVRTATEADRAGLRELDMSEELPEEIAATRSKHRARRQECSTFDVALTKAGYSFARRVDRPPDFSPFVRCEKTYQRPQPHQHAGRIKEHSAIGFHQ